MAKVLEESNADTFITQAGSVPLADLLDSAPSIKHVIWVVARTSRHLDWNEVPEGVGGKAEVSVWHDVIEEKSQSASNDLTALPSGNALQNVIFVSKDSVVTPDGLAIIEFTQKVVSHIPDISTLTWL